MVPFGLHKATVSPGSDAQEGQSPRSMFYRKGHSLSLTFLNWRPFSSFNGAFVQMPQYRSDALCGAEPCILHTFTHEILLFYSIFDPMWSFAAICLFPIIKYMHNNELSNARFLRKQAMSYSGRLWQTCQSKYCVETKTSSTKQA